MTLITFKEVRMPSNKTYIYTRIAVPLKDICGVTDCESDPEKHCQVHVGGETNRFLRVEGTFDVIVAKIERAYGYERTKSWAVGSS
jgi:hypothetical protein